MAMQSTVSTGSAQSNEALVTKLISDFQQGNLEAIKTAFAADAVWDLPGRGPLSGAYHGPDAIVGFLARSYELSGGTLRIDVYDILASEHGAAQVQRVTADHAGRHLDCVEVLAHEIVNGRITKTHHRPDSNAIDAFFA